MQEIKTKLKKYIIDTTYADEAKVNEETLIFKEGIFDSMGFVSLITFLEEEFGIETNDSDLLEENFESINAISQFVVRKNGKTN